MAYEPNPIEREAFRLQLSERMPSLSPDNFAVDGGISEKRFDMVGMRLDEVGRMSVFHLLQGNRWRVGMLAAFVERVRNRYSGAFVGADDRQSSLQVRKTADPELYFAGKVDGVLMVLNSATSYFQEQEDEATRKIYSNRLRPFVQQVAAANNGHVSSRLLNDYLMLTLHPDEDPETRDMRDLINYSRIFSDMLTDGTLIIGNRNTESEYFKLVADPVGHYEI